MGVSVLRLSGSQAGHDRFIGSLLPKRATKKPPPRFLGVSCPALLQLAVNLYGTRAGAVREPANSVGPSPSWRPLATVPCFLSGMAVISLAGPGDDPADCSSAESQSVGAEPIKGRH